MYDSLLRTEMLPKDLREDEPKFGHFYRHRRTNLVIDSDGHLA